MQFLVTAHDFKDGDAINRRLATRTAHLQGAAKLIEDGVVLTAGALLNDSGNMIGSVILCEIDSKEELVKILDSDPYTVARVWETYSIQAIKLAEV